jgi:hypothetical protein
MVGRPWALGESRLRGKENTFVRALRVYAGRRDCILIALEQQNLREENHSAIMDLRSMQGTGAVTVLLESLFRSTRRICGQSGAVCDSTLPDYILHTSDATLALLLVPYST